MGNQVVYIGFSKHDVMMDMTSTVALCLFVNGVKAYPIVHWRTNQGKCPHPFGHWINN